MQFSFPPAVGLLPRNRTHTQLRGKETGKSGAILDNIYFAFRLSLLYLTQLERYFHNILPPPPHNEKTKKQFDNSRFSSASAPSGFNLTTTDQ